MKTATRRRAHCGDDLRFTLEKYTAVQPAADGDPGAGGAVQLSDVAIAGKYAYNTYVGLGSVGSTTTLVTLFTGLLIGLGGGVNGRGAGWAWQ